jgi:hypothetical protein
MMDINSMLNDNTTHLEKSCRQLISTLGKIVTWKWDDRFETVLAEFHLANKDIIRPLITEQMGETWTADLATCPPMVVQTVIDCFGGLAPGQTLFTSDPDQEGLLLCAWWPWGNGKTISIRLGVFADTLSDRDNDRLTLKFRGWFGI